jgi:hypothetical protein
MEYWSLVLKRYTPTLHHSKYHREVIGNDVERLHKHREG